MLSSSPQLYASYHKKVIFIIRSRRCCQRLLTMRHRIIDVDYQVSLLPSEEFLPEAFNKQKVWAGTKRAHLTPPFIQVSNGSYLNI